MAGLSNTQSLLVSGTVLERALEKVTQRVDLIPTPLRDLWNPATCPARFLPWLAYALSVDAWDPTWSEPIKRNIVASAIEIQRRKGTSESVRRMVAAFGGAIAVREWWQMDPPGLPHTFDLVLTLSGQDGQPATQAFVDRVIDEVARTKPVRSHFDFTTGVQAEVGLGVAAAARAAVYCRLQLQEAA